MESSRTLKTLVFHLSAGISIVLATLGPVGSAQDRGELKIEGEHINRLVLDGDGSQTESWSDPNATVSLPVGTYTVRELTLMDDLAVQNPNALGRIEITKDAPAVLKAGGPLRQMIDIRRHGRTLTLHYRLVGIGEEAYRSPRRPEQRGTFTVYCGDKAIGQGAFEYG